MKECMCKILFINQFNTNVYHSPCDKTKKIVVQLYEDRHKYWVLKDKVQIFSKMVLMQDDIEYAEESFLSKRA